jgi:transposase
MNSLVTGLARHGADVAPGTLAGACAQAGALLAPLEDAITAWSRRSWHLHADETTWRVFAPRDGGRGARAAHDRLGAGPRTRAARSRRGRRPAG